MKYNFTVDTKGDWFKNRYKFLNSYLMDDTVPVKEREEFQRYKDVVVYETPKTYVDGVVYNPGDWVIYNTCKEKKGRTVTNIYVKDLKELVVTLYGYMVFLRVAGWNDRRKVLYSTIVFFDRLVYRVGLFDYSKKNIERLNRLVDIVMSKSVDDLTKDWTRGIKGSGKKGCWDERKFCIDTTGKTKTEISKLRNSIVDMKGSLDSKISELYDHSLSVKENLEQLHSKGVKVSRARLFSWLKENNDKGDKNDTPEKESKPDCRYVESGLDSKNELSQEEMIDMVLEYTKDYQ